MRAALVILNYNGRAHLETALPSALEAARAYGPGARVIVLDNQSTEPDAAFVRARFPEVELKLARRNDCVMSYNQIMPELEEEIVILLNNDMRFERDFIAPLVSPLADPGVFAVTARILDWEGKVNTTGRRIGYFKHAWFYRRWDTSIDRLCYTLDAGGGSAAFRRSMLVELGGFDALYKPGYFEDTDLSYRAWQRGWKVLYEPRSVIYHRVGASFAERLGGDAGRTRQIRRNEILFTVKNCGDGGFLLAYLLLLPLRAIRSLFTGNRPQAEGFWQALPKLPAALGARLREGRHRKMKDREFLRMIEHEMPSLR